MYDNFNKEAALPLVTGRAEAFGVERERTVRLRRAEVVVAHDCVEDSRTNKQEHDGRFTGPEVLAITRRAYIHACRKEAVMLTWCGMCGSILSFRSANFGLPGSM